MPTPTVITGLVAQWLHDGDATDNTGSHTTTVYGTPAYEAEVPTPLSGIVSNSVLLDKVDDYYETPHHADFVPVNISVMTWARPIASATGRIIGKDTTNGLDFSWTLQANYDFGSYPSFAATGFNRVATISPTMTLGVWEHLCGTFDGRFVKLYRNGVLVKTTDVGLQTIAGSSPVRIGRRGGSSAQWFGGNLSDTRVYSRAVTAGEVSEIYVGDYATPDDTPPTRTRLQTSLSNRFKTNLR